MIDYVLIPFIFHMITYWSLAGFFYLLDLKYLLHPQHYNWKMYRKALLTSLINQFTVTLPLTILLEEYVKNVTELSENDNTLKLVFKFISIITMSNILFYAFHRLLHIDYLYKRFHYIHHRFVEPVAVCALYCHPLEQLLSNTLPFYIPYVLIGLSYKWMIISIVLGTIVTISGHVMYYPNDHLKHHKLFKYNYGFGRYLDLMLNTHK
jgi:sterol desaturase/sphingolipid hydroxylase (fatty acid hydroxylase superfamily)